jgi:hypothetical protein
MGWAGTGVVATRFAQPSPSFPSTPGPSYQQGPAHPRGHTSPRASPTRGRRAASRLLRWPYPLRGRHMAVHAGAAPCDARAPSPAGPTCPHRRARIFVAYQSSGPHPAPLPQPRTPTSRGAIQFWPPRAQSRPFPPRSLPGPGPCTARPKSLLRKLVWSMDRVRAVPTLSPVRDGRGPPLVSTDERQPTRHPTALDALLTATRPHFTIPHMSVTHEAVSVGSPHGPRPKGAVI